MKMYRRTYLEVSSESAEPLMSYELHNEIDRFFHTFIYVDTYSKIVLVP